MTTFTLPRAAAAATPGAGQFLGVDWSSIALVFVVGLLVTAVVVTLYATGLRLLAVGSPVDGSDHTSALPSASARPLTASIGAFACIGVSAAAALYGIYLVIPILH